MKILKCLIVLLIIACLSCTKKTTIADSRNDSVQKYLKLASIDTLPTEIRKKHNHKAFSFIDLEKNDSVVRWYLFKTCDVFIDIEDSKAYYLSSDLHFKKSKQVRDTLNLARYNRLRGSYHRKNTKNLDSSFYYYLKAEKLFLRTNDKAGLAKVYLYLAHIQYDYSDYLGAEYNYLRALKILKNFKNYTEIFDVLSRLGNVNHNVKNYLRAIEYHKEALQMANLRFDEKLEKYHSISTCLNNIGNTYREIKNYDSAIIYFKEAIIEQRKLSERITVDPYSYNNLAYCYIKIGNYSQLPLLLLQASRAFDSLKITDEAAISRVYLAEYYAKIKDTSTAIQYANQSLQLAKKSKSSYYYLYTLSNAGTINKQKAPQYIAEYHRLNDSLLFEERKARNQYFKIQLETDEIAQQKDKAIKQKWVQTSIIASVLLIVILLFIIYKQRSQKKEFILIQNQQKASEEIYQLMLNQQSKEEEAKQKEKKRIAIELHDNVMNKLASTRFNLFSLTKKSDIQSLKKAVHHIDSIKEVEDEIRNITHELSKETIFKNNSFPWLLHQMINEQNQIHPTLYQLELDDIINWDIISSEIKMNYYRIIQEAIHNCNKYAAAKHSTISLFYEVNQLRLTISDNGKGFQANTTNPGIGLQNMKQRMESIHGKISINSEPGNGTVINCSVEIDVN
jgi:signal transduction histidine kinase